MANASADGLGERAGLSTTETGVAVVMVVMVADDVGTDAALQAVSTTAMTDANPAAARDRCRLLTKRIGHSVEIARVHRSVAAKVHRGESLIARSAAQRAPIAFVAPGTSTVLTA